MNRLTIIAVLLAVSLAGVALFGYLQSNRLATAQQQLLDSSKELFTTRESLTSSSQELSNTKNSLSSVSQELSSSKDALQTKQNELDTANQQTKDKATELLIAQNKLADSEKKVQSLQSLFPLRPFKSLSELQDFLFPSAKLYQLQLMDMEQDPRYTSYDWALFMQKEANSRGYSMSVQIDKASGQVFNTIFIDNKVYAIDPYFTVVGGNAINKVWEYSQVPVPSPLSQPTPTPPTSNVTSLKLTYENSTYKVKINYPEGWVIKDLSAGMVAFLTQKTTLDSIQTNVVMTVQTVSATNLRTYTQLTLNQGKQVITDFTLVESSKTTLSNNEAQRLVFTGRQGAYNLKSQIVFSVVNYTNVYSLSYTSDDANYPYYLDAFQQMVNSFQITR